MKKKHLILGLSLFLTSVLCAQTKNDTIFKNLHNGAILVRLRSNNILLKSLEQKNDTILLNKIIKERDKKNKEIIEAFSSFTYCPVYFFYSENSRKLANKEFDNYLLDKELKPIDNIPNLDNNYLIATFDAVREDTSWSNYSNYSTYVLQNNETGNLERRHLWNHASVSGIDALVLFNPDFQFLQEPYPHYVRTYENLLFNFRSKTDVINILQNEIAMYVQYFCR